MIGMGSFLDKPIVEKYSEDGASNHQVDTKVLYAASEMQGWRVTMEDSHTLAPHLPTPYEDLSLFACFDGHGGDLVAKEAAKRIVETLVKMPKFDDAAKEAIAGKKEGAEKIGQCLEACFLDLDEQLRQLEPVQLGEDQSGCTAIASVITPTHVIVANSGDSRGIVGQLNAETKRLEVVEMSHDHKPTNDTEIARIENAGGCVSMKRVNGDLAVSRALGDFNYKQRPDLKPEEQQVSAFPDIIVHDRNSTDTLFLLLCCDGIWDVMRNEEVCQYMVDACQAYHPKDSKLPGGEKLSIVCEYLLDKCLDKGSRDNMSSVLVLFPGIVPQLGTKPEPAEPPKRESEGPKASEQTMRLD